MLLAQFIRNAKVSEACFIATINTSTKFTLALHMSNLVHTYAKVSSVEVLIVAKKQTPPLTLVLEIIWPPTCFQSNNLKEVGQ